MLIDLPCRFLIAAPSQSGKSVFMVNLLRNQKTLLRGRIDNIWWCCSNINFAPKLLSEIPNLKIKEGLPAIHSIPSNTILVIDDLQMSNLKEICHLFTVGSHHCNISLFFIVQNLFLSNNHFRTISLNCTHFVLFKSLRDINQIKYLARQIFPEFQNSFLKIYKEATAAPFAYLIIDLSQTCCPILRIKSEIFNPNYFTAFSTNEELDSFSEIDQSNQQQCTSNFIS